MKSKTRFLFTLLTSALAFQGFSQTNLSNPDMEKLKTRKVLFVVTSTGQVPTNGEPTGMWLEEFTTPYYLLTDQGISVTIVSPAGGKAPIAPKSRQAQSATPSAERFNGDAALQEKLNNTAKLSTVKAADYDAVFYPGGHGPMWDLPENKLSIQLIEDFYAQGKPVALVCHAPAALKNVQDQKGEPLVQGKKVTGFTNSEETAGKSTAEVPFLLEDMLKEKGGIYERANDWQPFAIADGLLITGQNPASAALVAEKIIAALKETAIR
jgi:putative intracellular protease/amidase